MGSSSSLMSCVSTTGEAGGGRWAGVLMLQPPDLGAGLFSPPAHLPAFHVLASLACPGGSPGPGDVTAGTRPVRSASAL